MKDKTYIVISGKVDATIKEYQPDVDFKIFHNIDELSDYIDHDSIRAQYLFFTEDIVGQSNSAFSILAGLVTTSDFLSVDRVIYIAEEGSQTIRNLRYLIDEKGLEDWEIIKGSLTRAFIQEVINGTYRDDAYNAKRKVVIRRPRQDYIKQQLKNHQSLQEDYVDDDHDLLDIPDETIPEIVVEESVQTLKQIHISGDRTRERTAFSLLTAQYLSMSHRTLILESDPEYHLLTEFATKSAVDCDVVTVTDLYEDLAKTLDVIRGSQKNLVIVECIDRVKFDYRFINTLLYYNLESDFDYLITESSIEEVPDNTYQVVIVPSTITGLLQTAEQVDKSRLPYCDFVGVDLTDLPETHISSGLVMGKILDDVLVTQGTQCPVITISSLRLSGSSYDFGTVLGRSLAI